MASPSLDKERHLRYWKRCFRSYLPSQYTSHDSSRMAIAFFIVAAHDLLSPSRSSGEPQQLTVEDRINIRTWVLKLQHVSGGFCGSPTHALPPHLCKRYDAAAGEWHGKHVGNSNVAATYFALLLLSLASDGTKDGDLGAFAGVDRVATLRWLRTLQREDGSFGELVLDDGTIEGGKDMRLCYLACMIRWSLRGDVREGDPGWVEDINVEQLVKYIRRGQTYDGGMAESPEHESHAGYAYCAAAALYLLDRPPNSLELHDSETVSRGILSREALISFLVHRQFSLLEREGEEGDDEDEDEDGPSLSLPQSLEELSLNDTSCVGFNGRCNKVADTCYCWWVGGTLSILPGASVDLLATEPSRNFLFNKTQHLIGGFSKHPGGPPDVHHGYLGLAALATMGDPSLMSFDPSLCVSTETTAKIVTARTALLEATKASATWSAKFPSTSDFWSGKEAVWPKSTIDDEAQQKLAKALAILA
ncbi:type-1 proteins geranylgeranyltransferase subunit beta [Plectosphaerella plurivora]|uniref:Type-1 proteins geranylgeranyltransferase subunit beta n=1 Tax=Plectosphaerella plurivora TaxID=936078 RepID=A0A9P8V5N5_9PEZI|nr:type-1 proteins geranylgeranyltransferase subunit beta [Plectosphaerella plurivora]